MQKKELIQRHMQLSNYIRGYMYVYQESAHIFYAEINGQVRTNADLVLDGTLTQDELSNQVVNAARAERNRV